MNAIGMEFLAYVNFVGFGMGWENTNHLYWRKYSEGNLIINIGLSFLFYGALSVFQVYKEEWINGKKQSEMVEAKAKTN